MVLSLYLYLYSFFFSCFTLFAIIISSFSPFQVYIYTFLGIAALLCYLNKFLFAIFFCPFKYPTSPFLFTIESYLSVFSRLFINS